MATSQIAAPKKAPRLVTRKSATSVEVFERVDDGRFVGYAITKGVADEKDQPLTLSWVGAKIPLTPNDYQRTHQADLNEMRVAAGLPVRKIYKPDSELRSWQSAAGI